MPLIMPPQLGARRKLGFAVEDDDKAASVGLEALDLLGGGGTGRVDVYRGGTLHGVTSSLWWRVEVTELGRHDQRHDDPLRGLA